MMYSDADIREHRRTRAIGDSRELDDTAILIDGSDDFDRRLQPASLDVCLDKTFLIPDLATGMLQVTDMRQTILAMSKIEAYTDAAGLYFVLPPGQLLLGSTVERFELGAKIWARVEGKSSLGRIGLSVHVTAGFIDPGFRGHVTLELYNFSHKIICLRPGLPIAQISFGELKTRALRPYGSPGLGSKYQDQDGVTPARGETP